MLNLDKDKTALEVLVANTYDDLIMTNSDETIDHLNLYSDKNDPTTFLPLNTIIGGPVKSIKDTENICLITDQARYIYKKVEQEGIVSVDTIKQEMEEDKLSKNNIDDEEVNTYHNVIINNIDRENVIASQI